MIYSKPQFYLWCQAFFVTVSLKNQRSNKKVPCKEESKYLPLLLPMRPNSALTQMNNPMKLFFLPTPTSLLCPVVMQKQIIYCQQTMNLQNSVQKWIRVIRSQWKIATFRGRAGPLHQAWDIVVRQSCRSWWEEQWSAMEDQESDTSNVLNSNNLKKYFCALKLCSAAKAVLQICIHFLLSRELFY